MRIVYFYLMLILLSTHAFAQDTVLIDSNETNLTEFSSGYFIDANNLSFDEIKQVNFINGGSRYSLGTNAKNTWVKVGIKNNASHAQKLYLHMPEAFHNKQVAFYETSNKGKLLKQAIIDLNHAQDSPYIFQGSAIYEFNLSPQEIKTIYVQSVSFSHQWFTLKILDENHSKRALANTYNDIAFYVGILFALMIYNLMLQLHASSKANLFYSLYLLSGAIWISFHYGLLGNSFNWYGAEVFNLHLTLLVMPAFLALFMQHIFETKENYPTEHNLLNIIIILVTLTFVYGLFDISQALKPASTIALIIISLTLVVSISLIKKGNKLAQYFLLGHLFFIIFNVLAVLFYKGLVDYGYLVRHGVGIGIMLEALMMAFIISYKIRLLENDKQQLGRQAIIDPLTQAYNRRHFFTQADFLIKHRLCEQRPLSVLMLDIDNFKTINDRYGHQVGDDVLKSLSKMLMDSIDEDQILARFGGEEFAILLPNHNQQQAEYFASLLLEKTQNIRVLANQQELNITVSIGVAQMLENTAIESALNRADKALYLAKSNGKNQVASL